LHVNEEELKGTLLLTFKQFRLRFSLVLRVSHAEVIYPIYQFQFQCQFYASLQAHGTALNELADAGKCEHTSLIKTFKTLSLPADKIICPDQ
jgi:hypothetical protein